MAAVVLEYGLTSVNPAVMYSFFHQVSNSDGHDAPYLHKDKTQPHSLDGTNARTAELPLARSKIDQKESAEQVAVLYRQRAQQMLNFCNPDTQHANVSSDTGFDPNLDRRKRRRITSEGQKGSTIEQNDSTQDIRSRSEVRDAQDEAFVQGEQNDAENLVKSLLNNMDSSVESNEPVITSPQKRTPLRKQRQSNLVLADGVDQPLKDESDVQSVRSEARKPGRPKKKSLSLHANGKLLSSPTTGSLLTKEIKAANDRVTASTRNYKMRNGRFVQSLAVTLKYGPDEKPRVNIGHQIDAILSSPSPTVQSDNLGNLSKTHPFFLGKLKPKQQADSRLPLQGENTDESEPNSRQHEPVAWKDIKFSSQKPAIFKSAESIRPAWPPLLLHHIGNQLPKLDRCVVTTNRLSNAKLKLRPVQLQDGEDVMHVYANQLRSTLLASQSIEIPQKWYLSGAKVAQDLIISSADPHIHEAISSVRSAITSGLSAFDRGECAGPNMWPLHYSPTRWSEVLQPSVAVLHHWLQGLVIHNVKSGIDTSGNTRKLKGFPKKRRRKLKDELNDFIVGSDDDQESRKPTKNAILISGPNGCGKTASVYAVAKELGFEVFEIHPGMRRSAKDIFDKVGDMAHNHLVQKGGDFSRSSSVAPSDTDTNVETDIDIQETTVATLVSKTAAGAKKVDNPALSRAKRAQKQSLILFEEVDLLFDDDKGFWNGVQSLIQHTKRPVVMTCNDPSSIPVDDLDLYDILTYETIERELATDYLMSIAAAEGHILDREAVSNLYASKGSDLRASITELNFWCQMTVGSKQGGLDWMTKNLTNESQTGYDGKRLRIFSQGTFQASLDLVPQVNTDVEAAIRFNQDTLGIAASEWCDYADLASLSSFEKCDNSLQTLSRLSDITEARSVIDLFDDLAAPALALATARIFHCGSLAANRDVVASRYLKTFAADHFCNKELAAALEPIMVEKPTFPPSQGRLAPSLDCATSIVATDIAPYVRCIVNFDRRLEQQRDELFGSQGKSRKTRAARAAAEGGNKASTRSERWFPKDLAFDKVMKTAGDWPEWYMESQSSVQGASPALPSSTPEE